MRKYVQNSQQLTLKIVRPEKEQTEDIWQNGTPLAWLGTVVTLRLDSAVREPMLEGDHLYLPLPPAASPRQVQDIAEAWIRREALRLISDTLEAECARLGCLPLRASLSFSHHADWSLDDGRGGLRFHWRLAEQSEEIVRQVVRHAITRWLAKVSRPTSMELFAAA
ncbi:MAG: DUF45 domain-containing protein [Rhodocyclaceae bacterium]|nr:DUF45 domain-containing protein [Rhodocyclaceae bacterium]